MSPTATQTRSTLTHLYIAQTSFLKQAYSIIAPTASKLFSPLRHGSEPIIEHTTTDI
jgi:hypothetical protein